MQRVARSLGRVSLPLSRWACKFPVIYKKFLCCGRWKLWIVDDLPKIFLIDFRKCSHVNTAKETVKIYLMSSLKNFRKDPSSKKILALTIWVASELFSKSFFYLNEVCGLDINECVFYSPCKFGCRNTDGSYACECPEGYEVQGTDCIGNLHTRKKA